MNKKPISKKGIIFTMVSIVLSTIIIAAFFFTQTPPTDISVSSTELRIKTVNNFIKQMDTYIPSQMKSTSRASIINMTLTTIKNDRYYHGGSRFQSQFERCLKTKGFRINGLGLGNTEQCSESLQEKLDIMENISLQELNINSSLNLLNVHIFQRDPWNVIIRANVSIDVIDGYAEWHVNKSYEANVSIIGIPDPTYSIGIDNEFITKKLNYTNNFTTEEPFNGWQRYPSTLNRLAIQKKYFEFPGNSPDFLSRLNGDLNARNQYGIASIVIYRPGAPFNRGVSNLDFIAWKKTNCGESNLYTVDFYNPQVSPNERSNLEIPEANVSENRTLNATVLSVNLINMANMSNIKYYPLAATCQTAHVVPLD